MDPQVLSLLQEGQSFAGQGDWTNALDCWNRAVAVSADKSGAQSWVATLLAGFGRLDDAKTLLKSMAMFDADKAAATASEIGLNLWEQRQDLAGALQLMGLSLQIAGARSNFEQLALTSGNLGNVLSAVDSLESALIHYENAAGYYRRLGGVGWASMMLSSAGGMLKDLERYAEAEEKLKLAKELAVQANQDAALVLALLNLGSLYGAQGSYGQSKSVHCEALRIAWRDRNVEYIQKSAGNLALDLRNLQLSGLAEAEELVSMAIADFRQKQYDWAIFGLKYAAYLVDGAQAPIGLADIYHTLSNVEYAVGETKEALGYLQEARELARRAGQPQKLVEYCAGLSHLYLEQGQLAEAADASDEAIAAASGLGPTEAFTAAIGNRGIVALRRDELNLAEELFLRQYILTQEIGQNQQRANAANSLGAVCQKMGDIPAAEKWFDLSIEASEGYKWPAGLRSLVNKAMVQRQQGQIDTAIDTYQDALIRAIGAEDADAIFDILLNLGILHLKVRRKDKARSYFEQAAEWNAGDKDPRKSALLAMNQAYLHKEEGQSEKALHKFREANAFFNQSDWENAARCAVEAAILLLDSGRLDEALTQILPAADQYEQRLRQIPDYDAWRMHQEEELCFQVLSELMRQKYGPELALLAAERSRGRAFRLALRRREAGHRTQAFDYQQILRQTMLEVVTSGKAQGMQKEFVDRFIQALSGAKDPQELDLNGDRLKAWASRFRVAMVVYGKGYPEQLYAWVVDATHIHFAPIDLTMVGGWSGLFRCIGDLRKDLGVPERGAGILRGRSQKDPDALLRKLYEVLIAPLAKWLPEEEGARLCLAPWGPLFQVPFCALRNEQGRYLVDRYATFVVPTLYFFDSAREVPGERPLVVGNPIPTGESSFGELPPLPFAEVEAREVAGLYGVEALLGEQAGKARILQELPDAGMVHLAAHGLLNEIYPLRSAIVLTQTADDNGLLYAADLKKLSLRCRLVVLSACSTALGNITGDGVLGLCREFLAAGTDSVLASLWAVADRSSAVHMKYFHEFLREKPVIEALREAQLATRKEFTSIVHWGAYALWGWPE